MKPFRQLAVGALFRFTDNGRLFRKLDWGTFGPEEGLGRGKPWLAAGDRLVYEV